MSLVVPYIHPRPKETITACPKCLHPSLPSLELCQGKSIVTNFGRWYQRCNKCGYCHFYNPPTDVQDIPVDVQTNFALRASVSDAKGGLNCQQPSCLTTKGGPRPANKLCDRSPPRCSQCCKSAGGCRIHRLLGTSGSVSALPLSTLEDSQATAPTTHTQPPVGLRSSYARPLNPSYANPYLEAQQRREQLDQRAIQERDAAKHRMNTISVVIWTKVLEEPTILKVVSHEPDVLVPGHHSEVKSLILEPSEDSSALIFVFTVDLHDGNGTWVSQRLSVPIEVLGGKRVLLRRSDVEPCQCTGLNKHLDAVCRNVSSLAEPLAPVISRTLSLSPHHSNTEQISASGQPPSTSTASLMTLRPLVSIRFPLTYACDMSPRLATIANQAPPGASLDKLRACFDHEFGGCSFVKSTYYKHAKFYTLAKEAGILNEYVRYGRTTEGKWDKLIKAVRKLPTITSAAVESNDNLADDKSESDEDEPSYDMRTFAIDMFHFDSGELKTYKKSFSTTMQYSLAPSYISNHRTIHLMCQYTPGKQERFAVKFFNDSGRWWQPYGPFDNRELFVWVEASKVARCHIFQGAFFATALRIAPASEILLFEALPAFLIDFLGTVSTEIGQKWSDGLRFKSRELERSKGSLGETLEAFSHFIYDYTDRKSVMTDFEGHRHASGDVKLFNCTLHTEDNDESYDRLLRGNLGQIGIECFIQRHKPCNEICKSMNLSSL